MKFFILTLLLVFPIALLAQPKFSDVSASFGTGATTGGFNSDGGIYNVFVDASGTTRTNWVGGKHGGFGGHTYFGDFYVMSTNHYFGISNAGSGTLTILSNSATGASLNILSNGVWHKLKIDIAGNASVDGVNLMNTGTGVTLAQLPAGAVTNFNAGGLTFNGFYTNIPVAGLTNIFMSVGSTNYFISQTVAGAYTNFSWQTNGVVGVGPATGIGQLNVGIINQPNAGTLSDSIGNITARTVNPNAAGRTLNTTPWHSGSVEVFTITNLSVTVSATANTIIATNGFSEPSNSIPVAVTVGASPFLFTNTTTANLKCRIADSTTIILSVGIDGVTVYPSTTDLNLREDIGVGEYLTFTYSGGTPTLYTNK